MNHRTRTTIALTAAALTLLGLVGCSGTNTSTPEDTANGFFEAVLAEDAEKALEYVVEDYDASELEFAPVSSVKLKEVTVDGDEALVYYDSVRISDGETYGSSGMRMEKIDGEWLITSPYLLTGL